MTYAATSDHNHSPELKAQWLALKSETPQLRPRDAADRLGVSEAELVAVRCGEGVRRLKDDWAAIIKALPGLGTVMALTRNEHVVHEKVGRYDKISIFKSMGLVLAEEIDLRLFLDHWHFGFAVEEETRSGLRRSLQFFDRDGTAVHKIYLIIESDQDAYEALVRNHLDKDQSAGIVVAPPLARAAERADTDIDLTLLRHRWATLQDVHDFHSMLNAAGARRVQAFRLIGTKWAYPVVLDSFRTALQKAADTETPLMIFAGSPGVIQIHTGAVKTLKEMGPWYNVLDPGFNLHLRQDRIASAWVVKKPTRDGIVTSLEIFDRDEEQIAWMFGRRKPGEAEREDWRTLVDGLPLLEGPEQ